MFLSHLISFSFLLFFFFLWKVIKMIAAGGFLVIKKKKGKVTKMSVPQLWDLMLELRITTLGAGSSGGTVNILNLSEPLDLNSSIPTDRARISEIASFEYTVWTADCSHDQKQAIVGKSFPSCLLLLKSFC